jgi:AcrR family transcriptional regulator
METIRVSKRNELRTRLIDVAQARIEAGGLKTLRARDVTGDAGIALGGLYNAFADLDDLVLHVNSRTLARLDAAIRQAVAAAGPDPAARLKALALAYLGFASSNRTLWSALFEHRQPEGTAVPDWHRAELGALFDWIAEPIATLRPELSVEELALASRTLFAAVHGIVAISLEERLVGLAPKVLEAQLARFVDTHVAGMARETAPRPPAG